MEVLLVPLGSYGDIHPFLGLGLALRARGHGVTVISKDECGPLIRSTGLDFVPLPLGKRSEGPADGWLRRARRVLRSIGGRWRRLARASTVVPLLRPVYAAIAQRYVPGRTVVAASSMALGARLAQEKLGVPLATIHLSPVMFRSAHRAPLQPPLVLPDWLPPWSKRAAYWLVDRLVLDRQLAGPANALRAELDLPPVHRLFDAWRHSPQRVIGLFPGWFAPPQPDWPATTRLTGFPLYDGGTTSTLPADVQHFLDHGAPPLVFTPGTSIREGGRFLKESVAACRLLACRGLLLSRFREHLPAALPADVRHFDYLPFRALLPRVGALVHFGGIGTAAQALAAGIPQLIVPLKNDQHDNARRLAQLGVARVLSPRTYRAGKVVRALSELLTSDLVAWRCRTLAERFRHSDPLGETCRLLEELCPGGQTRECDPAPTARPA